MMTKTVKPIVAVEKCIGTVIEYRIFGLLLYKKTLNNPPASEDSRVWFIYGF